MASRVMTSGSKSAYSCSKLPAFLKLTHTDPCAVTGNATPDGIRVVWSVLGTVSSLPIAAFRKQLSCVAKRSCRSQFLGRNDGAVWKGMASRVTPSRSHQWPDKGVLDSPGQPLAAKDQGLSPLEKQLCGFRVEGSGSTVWC